MNLVFLLFLAALAVAQPLPGPSATIHKDDRLQIAATDVPGVNDKPVLVEQDGTVTLPLVGKVQADGLTVEEFTRRLTTDLKTYIRNPRVAVKLVAKTETNIAVGTGFKNPGVHPLPEGRSLLNVIAAVGGLQSGAGTTVKIVRRLEMGAIPLASAVEDTASNVSTATVNINKLMESPGALSELTVKPNDVLSAEPPNTVYVTGEVLKPGAQDLSDRESIGLTELLSLAGGVSREADPRNTRVLRRILNGAKRAEIPVDVTSILGGESVDFAIQPNDIVEVPRGRSKPGSIKAALRYVVPAAASGLVFALIRR